MRDDYDIENIMKRHGGKPSPRVKREVMDAFMREYRNGERRSRTVGLWKKPVPFYMFAASLALFMALSFYAGKSTSRQAAEPSGSHELMRYRGMVDTLEITWSITERDLF